MKPLVTSLLLSLSSSLLLTQCASAPAETVRAAGVAAPVVASASNDVTVKVIGDTSVATRKLINRPLTNKDIGKVYEVVTYATPLGVKSEERIIVRTSPKLQTKVVSR